MDPGLIVVLMEKLALSTRTSFLLQFPCLIGKGKDEGNQSFAGKRSRISHRSREYVALSRV